MGRDLTFLGLLANADPIVKAVIYILAFASVASWGVAFEKLVRLIGFSCLIGELERQLSNGHGAFNQQNWFIDRLLSVVEHEPYDCDESRTEYIERLERSLQIEGSTQLRRLQFGLRFLATVGSTAPFVGLFGTVWGIMHSFTGIAAAKDTSLAVVAPGIAEALFATAIGLAAAIPAVIFYNQANVSLARLADRLLVAIGKFAKANVYGKTTHFSWRTEKPPENGGRRAID